MYICILIFTDKKVMKPEVKTEADGSLTISVNFVSTGSCLEQEEALALALNALGLSATVEILQSFEEVADVLEVEGAKYTSKGKKKRSTSVHMGK